MKNLTFFKEEENLLSILQNTFSKNIDKSSVKKISTGWTNIVLEFNIGDTVYIARFPRNNFFSKAIEKDAKASKFLKKELNVKTSEMDIYYCENRPFSIHKKVNGVDLGQKIDQLDNTALNKIAIQIAEFYSKLHNFKIKEIPEEFNITLSQFLGELAKVDDDYYDYSDNNELEKDEKNELVFVHGDLNIRNILIDENNDITAFIDFAFFGLSERHIDLSRMYAQVKPEFLKMIIDNYEKIANFKIDNEKINKRNKMWKYIEDQYIVYMKNYHPEIKLPA